MRGAGLYQSLQLRRVRAERTVPTRKPRLQSFNRTIQHDHPSERLSDLPVFGIKERPTSQRNDAAHLGRRRPASAD